MNLKPPLSYGKQQTAWHMVSQITLKKETKERTVVWVYESHATTKMIMTCYALQQQQGHKMYQSANDWRHQSWYSIIKWRISLKRNDDHLRAMLEYFAPKIHTYIRTTHLYFCRHVTCKVQKLHRKTVKLHSIHSLKFGNQLRRTSVE